MRAPLNLGEVLLLGNEGAGKTLLCRQMDHYCQPRDKKAGQTTVNATTQPSVGVEILHVNYQKKAFSVREVGGVMQPVWPRYFESCSAAVLVADTSSSGAAAAAAIEWYSLLMNPALQRKPLLLLLNKRDRPHALDEPTLQLLMRIAECEAIHGGEGRVSHLFSSALTGEGVPGLLDWMSQALLTIAKERDHS